MLLLDDEDWSGDEEETVSDDDDDVARRMTDGHDPGSGDQQVPCDWLILDIILISDWLILFQISLLSPDIVSILISDWLSHLYIGSVDWWSDRGGGGVMIDGWWSRNYNNDQISDQW